MATRGKLNIPPPRSKFGNKDAAPAAPAAAAADKKKAEDAAAAEKKKADEAKAAAEKKAEEEKAKAATAAKKEDPPKKEEPKADEDSGAKAHRATSNVFSMFQQSQIQEFKEAFGILDGDRDGVITVSDLKAIYSSLGREPSESELKEMLKECPGQLNFTAFLTLFGEKMHGTDPESTLKSAFAMFDRDGKGLISEEYLKDLLTNTGDQFKENELKAMWKEAPVSNGMFDYNAYVTLIKRGNQDE